MTYSAALKYNKTQTSRRGNPLRFRNVGKSSALTRALFFLITAGATVLIYWLFISSAFAIEIMEIRGTFALPKSRIITLIQSQLEQKRWYLMRQNNIFAFDAKSFSDTIAKQFAIDNIQIEKQHPHTIMITILEKPRKAIWSSRGIAYALDAEGIIIGATTPTADNQLTIYDKSGGVVEPGASVLSAEAMRFLNDLIENAAIKLLNPQFVMVENINPDYIIVKFDGWKAYFSLTVALKEQIDNLDLVLRHSILPDKRKDLDYIDLRFGKKVYYK